MSNHQSKANYHLYKTKATSSPFVSSPSSSPLSSASLPSSVLPTPGPPSSSYSTSFSSSPLAEASSSFFHDDQELSLELAIQYGRGQCPYSFLPPSLIGTSRIQKSDVNDADDSSGSIILSIPMGSTSLAENRGILNIDASAKSRTTHNNKSTKQNFHRVRVRWYRFQPSLSAEMEGADVILTHAGAGTLLEALAISSSTKSAAKQKIINAVINPKLMNNHQLELAEELERREHICVTRDCTSEWTTEDRATKFWEEIGEFSPLPFVGGRSSSDMERQGLEEDPNEHVSSFQRMVDGVMGFHQNWSADDSIKKTR